MKNHKKICTFCGETFHSQRKDAKTCSSTCRVYLYKLNNGINEKDKRLKITDSNVTNVNLNVSETLNKEIKDVKLKSFLLNHKAEIKDLAFELDMFTEQEYSDIAVIATESTDLLYKLAEQAPGWSLYRYGFNNPIMFIDPNGMFEDDGWWIPKGEKEMTWNNEVHCQEFIDMDTRYEGKWISNETEVKVVDEETGEIKTYHEGGMVEQGIPQYDLDEIEVKPKKEPYVPKVEKEEKHGALWNFAKSADQ